MKHGSEYRIFARKVMKDDDGRDYDGVKSPTDLDSLEESDLVAESAHTLDSEADWQEEYDGQSTLEEADQESLDYLFGEVLGQDIGGGIDPYEAEKVAGVTRKRVNGVHPTSRTNPMAGERETTYPEEEKDPSLALGELTERGERILDSFDLD